jgi:Ribosomal protein L7/L12
LFSTTTANDQEYEQNNITEQVREILYADDTTNKIAAIKKHRELTGFGLKESKEWVEQTFKV